MYCTTKWLRSQFDIVYFNNDCFCLQRFIQIFNTFRPYYEMKAHFNYLLEQQKIKVQHYESQVSTAKLTYAEALRNLEQISDEIHQTRRKASLLAPPNKQMSQDSNESFLEDAQEFVDEYKSLPATLGSSASPCVTHLEEIGGFRNFKLSGSPENPSVTQSHSSEWTEINLDSSPDDDIPYRKLQENGKTKLVKQKTLPNPKSENEFSAIKNKMKLDTNISNWISRSSAKNDDTSLSSSRRQSLDNILGPTGEKVKEIFSHGMMMLNISSLTERRNSEPKAGLTEDKSKTSAKKIPSPLEKTLTYLTVEDDSSDTESLSSVDMLNEEQINSLMLDKDLGTVCEHVLGTPICEVVSFPQCASFSASHPSK